MTRVLLTILCSLLWTLGAGCKSSESSRYDYMKPDYRSGSKSYTTSTQGDTPEEKSKRSWSLFSSKNKGDQDKKSSDEPDNEQLSPKDDTPYRLEAGDTVGIVLSGIPTRQEYTDIINDDGFINLAYIDKVKAAGLTPSELEELVQKTYIEKKIYKQLTVNVLMQAQSYFVRGEVRSPGRFGLPTEGVTLVQAIAAAGGLNEWANIKNVQLLRDQKTYTMNVKELEEKPGSDVELEAGDVIVVKRRFL